VTALFGVTIGVLTRTVTGQDADGNDVYGDVETPVRGCVVYLASSTERIQGQDLVIDDLVLQAPPGTALTPLDRVRYAGVIYEVYGKPFAWSSALTGAKGRVEARLRRVTG
jgi:hypothetical protein